MMIMIIMIIMIMIEFGFHPTMRWGLAFLQFSGSNLVVDYDYDYFFKNWIIKKNK